MDQAPMLVSGLASHRRSVGECPMPTAATFPRCSQIPRPSFVRYIDALGSVLYAIWVRYVIWVMPRTGGGGAGGGAGRRGGARGGGGGGARGWGGGAGGANGGACSRFLADGGFWR